MGGTRDRWKEWWIAVLSVYSVNVFWDGQGNPTQVKATALGPSAWCLLVTVLSTVSQGEAHLLLHQ